MVWVGSATLGYDEACPGSFLGPTGHLAWEGRVRRLLIALLASLVGCGSSADPRAEQQQDHERSAAIYAAVIRQLVTKDHTFGGGDPGFRTVYVIDGPVRPAANSGAQIDALAPDGPFPADVKAGLERRLTDLPPLEFVADRESVVVPDPKVPTDPPFTKVRDGGVLITLGPIPDGGDRVEVGANLWISALAGIWLTYVVERTESGWEVTGTTGPAAIS